MMTHEQSMVFLNAIQGSLEGRASMARMLPPKEAAEAAYQAEAFRQLMFDHKLLNLTLLNDQQELRDAKGRISFLEAELMKAREDSARLDWLDRDTNQGRWAKSVMAFNHDWASREAIDIAIRDEKEANK